MMDSVSGKYLSPFKKIALPSSSVYHFLVTFSLKLYFPSKSKQDGIQPRRSLLHHWCQA